MAACPFCAPPPEKAADPTRLGAAPAPAPAAPPPAAAPVGVPTQPYLDIIEGSNRGMRIDLGPQPITIGRAPDNSVCIKDASVSSHHARIDFYQGKYFLSDLQSSNGTYINNARIEQSQLKNSDVVVMGGSRMIVHLG
jgi:pSer/pThr/pTyr-binding forkhead associated (FHA) protein